MAHGEEILIGILALAAAGAIYESKRGVNVLGELQGVVHSITNPTASGTGGGCTGTKNQCDRPSDCGCIANGGNIPASFNPAPAPSPSAPPATTTTTGDTGCRGCCWGDPQEPGCPTRSNEFNNGSWYCGQGANPGSTMMDAVQYFAGMGQPTSCAQKLGSLFFQARQHAPTCDDEALNWGIISGYMEACGPNTPPGNKHQTAAGCRTWHTGQNLDCN